PWRRSRERGAFECTRSPPTPTRSGAPRGGTAATRGKGGRASESGREDEREWEDERRLTADQISLLGLRAFGRHGVFSRERREGQEFVVDAVLWLDTRAAAAADDLSLTVDYGALAARLAGEGLGRPGGADRHAGGPRGGGGPAGPRSGGTGGGKTGPKAAGTGIHSARGRDRDHPPGS